LGPRLPNGRPTAAIQQLELKSSRINGLAHQPAKRVYLSDQMAFSGSADRWVAGHQRDGLAIERTQPDRTTKPGRRPRRLDAGVTRANNHYIELHCRPSTINLICLCVRAQRTASKYQQLDST
jgi:hypothetical protein